MRPRSRHAFFFLLLAPWLLVLEVGGAGAPAAWGQPLDPKAVPPALQPWIPWVLRGAEEQRCPLQPGAGEPADKSQGDGQRVCAWAGELSLDLGPAGGRFTQSWEILAPSDVPLPGDSERRPIDVRVGGRPVAVLDGGGSPTVRLPAGRHSLSGSFSWKRLPETLVVPDITGVVSLRLAGKAVAEPRRDEAGTLFLGSGVEPAGKPAAPENDALEIDVQRKLTDEIPARLSTRVRLRVSGKSREVILGRVLPEGFVAHAVSSPLPLRLEADGRVHVQLRAGDWTFELEGRHPTPLTAVARPTPGGPWKEGAEVWVFEARPQLRVATVEDVPPVNADQVALPDEWKQLPAYLMSVGARLRLQESRRGNAQPAPDQLSLQRHLWLDFDGGGFTARDQITGSLSRSWRLDAGPDLILGRVSVGGADQFITKLGNEGAMGVEVREPSVQMIAEGRLRGRRGDLPAVGWAHDFQSVAATLAIPPGWRLVHASGPDSVQTSWLRRWTLLDLFLVTVLVMATGRLFGRAPAALALLTLVLVLQERDAPAWIWLAVLLGEALVRGLPAGRLRKLAKVLRLGAAAVLVIMAIPFAVKQARMALHPALESRQPEADRYMTTVRLSQAKDEEESVEADHAAAPPPMPDRVGGGALGDLASSGVAQRRRVEFREEARAGAGVSGLGAIGVRGAAPSAPAPAPARKAKADDRLQTLDPDARIQTGPGIPAWSWSAAELGWNGPVKREARLTLWLAPPWLVSLSGLAGAVLVVVLSLLLLRRALSLFGRWLPVAAGLALLLGLPPGSAQAQPAGGGFPPQELLGELRKRLLEKAPCSPHCASFGRLALEGTPADLRLRLEVNAAAEAVVDLPGLARHWAPSTVLLDEKPAAVRRDGSGRLWLLVTAGSHRVTLQGPLPDRQNIQIPFGKLRPHAVTTSLRGLGLTGIAEDGTVGESLELVRAAGAQGAPAASSGQGPAALNLPPFVMVERRLELGRTDQWRVHTRVVRLTPPGAAVVLEVPLLARESVLSSEIKVVAGKVQVNMGPDEESREWISALAQHSPIALKAAPSSSPWVERWWLDVSPTWHAEASGLPPVHPGSAPSDRVREFRPWPGESLSVAVTRPTGTPGSTFTFDSSQLTLTPGARTTNARLTLTLRSSRGGVHSILLPEGAELDTFSVDGQIQPGVLQGRRLTLPLLPGQHQVDVVFRTSDGLTPLLRTPAVDLGAPSVNASVRVNLPSHSGSASRWVLLAGGPRLGPAVLVWGVLPVLVLVAVFLGRSPLTPLSTRQWILLGLGFLPLSIWVAASIAGFLFALGWRRDRLRTSSPWLHDLVQVVLAIWTAVALAALFAVIRQGLLASPDMDIAGNNSHAGALQWYEDRVLGPLPRAWVVSLPLLVYHLAMLAWALWLAVALLRWSMWAWSCFTEGGLWRPLWVRRSPPPAPPPPEAPPA